MFARTFFALSALALSALPARAEVTPTSPDGTTAVKVGDTITALWDADTTGTWTDLEIQLMTGPNLDMVALATVATGIDGTSTTSYSFAAPDVTPYSKIYFLQFTNGGDMTNVTWTTRFTIEGTDGSSTDPTNSTTTDGTTVEWGTGTLLSNITTASSNSTSSTTASSSASTTASSIAAAATSNSVSTASSSSASSTDSASSAASTTKASSTSASSSSASASTSSKSSGAGRIEVAIGSVVFAGVAALTLL